MRGGYYLQKEGFVNDRGSLTRPSCRGAVGEDAAEVAGRADESGGDEEQDAVGPMPARRGIVEVQFLSHQGGHGHESGHGAEPAMESEDVAGWEIGSGRPAEGGGDDAGWRAQPQAEPRRFAEAGRAAHDQELGQDRGQDQGDGEVDGDGVEMPGEFHEMGPEVPGPATLPVGHGVAGRRGGGRRGGRGRSGRGFSYWGRGSGRGR